MRFLDLTLATPAENLALDEALLDTAEASSTPLSILRIWEPEGPMVVLGRSSRIQQEVRCAECRAQGVPVLRRASGGAAIVTGPGCLMYALVLSYRMYPDIRAVDQAHRFVLSTIVAGLRSLVPNVKQLGISDLAVGERKFSGNSMRCKQGHLLYHGTILYNFPLLWIERYLDRPPREPDYRQGRAHALFVANLPAQAADIRHALQNAWNAYEPCTAWPRELTGRLTVERYSRPEWNEAR